LFNAPDSKLRALYRSGLGGLTGAGVGCVDDVVICGGGAFMLVNDCRTVNSMQV